MKALRFLIVLLTVCTATFLIWNLYYRSWHGIDDANIYFVYMRNFAQGHGFVYNAGSERVEGFTSLLWTLIGAGIFLITHQVEYWLLALNILLVSYALYRLLNFVEDFTEQQTVISPYGLMLLGLTFAIAGYFEWTVASLMETGLWSMLLLLLSLEVFQAYERPHIRKDELRFSLLLVLLVLCRPEALLWSMVFIGLRAFRQWSLHGNLWQAVRSQMGAVAVVVLTIAALTWWRVYYFGYPLPNTYYAKVSSDRLENLRQGAIYIIRYLFNVNPLPIIILPAAAAVLLQKRRWQVFAEPSGQALLILLVAFGIPFITGGDHFAYGRFLQPVTPLMWMLFVAIWRHLRLPVAYGAAVLWVAFCLFVPRYSLANGFLQKSRGESYFSPMAYEWSLVLDGRRVVGELHDFFRYQPKYPSIGIFAAGAAYTYKGFTCDLLGLNNVTMAHAERVKDAAALKNHASFSHKVFLQQQPDLFWLYDSICDRQSAAAISSIRLSAKRIGWTKAIHRNPAFQNSYSAVIISCDSCPKSLITFASGNFLQNKLDKRYYSYRVISYAE